MVRVDKRYRLVVVVATCNNIECKYNTVPCAAATWFNKEIFFRKIRKLIFNMMRVACLGNNIYRITHTLCAVVCRLQ